jgi:hypothetical protein
MDFVQDGQCQHVADARDRVQEVEGVGVVPLGDADERPFEVAEQEVVLVQQRRIEFDALAHARVGKARGHPGAVCRMDDRPLEGRHLILIPRVLDVRHQLPALAHQMQRRRGDPASRASPPGRRRTAATAAPERPASLRESIAAVLAFPPWMAFIARAWPSTNGIPSAAQTSASQYQVNMHSAATTRSSRYGATVASNASGVDGTFRCTSTSPAPSRMQTYMVFTSRSIPQ